MFVQINFNEDLKKLSGVGTYSKKIYACIEHVKRYQKFKEIKKKLKNLAEKKGVFKLSEDNLDCKFELY